MNENISFWIIPGITTGKVEYSIEIGKYILKKLAAHYKVQLSVLPGKNRRSDLVYIRQVFCYWMYDYFDKISLNQIGSLLCRDHTTVIYSKDTFQERLDTNSELPDLLKSPARTVDDYSITDKYLRSCLLQLTVSVAQGEIH